MVLGLNAGVGFDLTDRLSVGAAATLGTGFEQLGLVSNSAMVHDYAVRGTLGVDYKLTPENTVGPFYQSKESFQFPNAVFIGGAYRDIRLTQPDTFGMGLANTSLMGGNLLLAADVYYKLWGDAAGYSDIFVNQWAVAFGAAVDSRQDEVPLGLLLQQQSHQPQRGKHLRRPARASGPDLPPTGLRNRRDQPAPLDGRVWAAGLPVSGRRPGLLRRRDVQRHGPVRSQHAGFGGALLRRSGPDLALRRLPMQLRGRRRTSGGRGRP